jgi:NAD(P)-dependent dehydrogenase (short-subunit alcohol dehydrogenase family)
MFDRVVSDIMAREGRVDYLFNNAGIGIAGEISDYDLDAWEKVFDVNLRGVAYGIQSVYPVMQRQGSGHIINTASMAGLLPIAGAGSYTATKHAVVGLSKVLRVEAKRHGVRVSVLCPGAIRTPILVGGKFGGHVGEYLKPEDAEKFWKWMRPMNVDTFAQHVLRDVEKNEAYIIVPRRWKAAWALERMAPRLSQRVWGFVHGIAVKEIEKRANAT